MPKRRNNTLAVTGPELVLAAFKKQDEGIQDQKIDAYEIGD